MTNSIKHITVLGIMDKDTGLLWNRIHKKFCPLTQNTLFVKNKGQYERLVESRTCGYIKYSAFVGKNIVPVEIEITIKDQ